jgi:D-amino-acid dehydrogenase
VSKPLSSAPHSLVIGGGVIGLTTAWALLQVGHRVSLIEQGELAGGASRANGGQLSYRYVSPLADAGVPWKAIGWLFDPEGPLCFRPELQAAQWSWLAQFLWKCRASVNRAATERLLRLGRFSQQTFQIWQQQLQLQGIALREPGKLVVYRQAGEFAKVRQRMAPDGVEQLLDEAACQRIEPALQASGVRLAGGVFTPGEAGGRLPRAVPASGRALARAPPISSPCTRARQWAFGAPPRARCRRCGPARASWRPITSCWPPAWAAARWPRAWASSCRSTRSRVTA